MGVYKVESCVCVVFGLAQFVSNSFIGFELNWVVGYWFGVLVKWKIDGKVIGSNRIIGKVCSCLLSCGGRHYSALHPPGWLTVGGFAVGVNGGVGPDSEPVSAMRLSLSPVGTSGGAIVVAGSVLFVLVVLGSLARLCLESLRGGLVMVVEVPVARPCCFIKSWMASLMVAIWASKLVWVSCIAVWACCMWFS